MNNSNIWRICESVNGSIIKNYFYFVWGIKMKRKSTDRTYLKRVIDRDFISICVDDCDFKGYITLFKMNWMKRGILKKLMMSSII